ncbi:retropepsin-like aspartic protease [Breznakiellaceae bacterium SP9]
MESQAFTIRENDKIESIITPVTVQQSIAFCQYFNIQTKQIEACAMWDTGANGSCISRGLAQKLNLKSIEIRKVEGIHGIKKSNVYITDSMLPNKLTVANVRVTEYLDNDDFDIIIGMDIITLGDFSLSNDKGKSVFSFRLPW